MCDLVAKMEKLDWLWIGSLLLVIFSTVGLAHICCQTYSAVP
jgi:hypothetical protein